MIGPRVVPAEIVWAVGDLTCERLMRLGVQFIYMHIDVSIAQGFCSLMECSWPSPSVWEFGKGEVTVFDLDDWHEDREDTYKVELR